MTSNTDMREFMEIAQCYSDDFYHNTMEYLVEHMVKEETPLVETVVEPTFTEYLKSELEALVFKLKAFQETENGDYAMGVEVGMRRAAEMIENLIMKLENE